MHLIKWILKAVANLIGLKYNRFILGEGSTDLKIPVKKTNTEITFREVKLRDLETSGKYFEKKEISEMRERLSKGWLLYGGFDGQDLVAYAWFTRTSEPAPRTGIKVPLDSGEVLSFFMLIHPDYRNMGLGSALRTEANRLLKEEKNIQKLKSVISLRNYAARRINHKLGSKAVSLLYLIRLGRFRIQFQRRIREPESFWIKGLDKYKPLS